MGGFIWISSMLITSCCCIIIILSVVQLAIATGHAMQIFNDLHYSNRCRFINIACIWPVAMASLPLNTVQCLYKNTKGLFTWRGVTRQGELLGNGEIPAVIETNSNPGWLFTWCSRVTRLGEFPAKSGGISPRPDEYFPCKHFARVTRPQEIECTCFAIEI
jgi:hypothetical protein